MPAKAVVIGVTLVIMISLLMFMVEFFLPLSKKAELDMLCRSTILRMENAGGLSDADRQELCSKLLEKGLTDVKVTASSNTRQGGILNLYVEGDYVYNRITALFMREDEKIHMVYNKSSMSRKVVN